MKYRLLPLCLSLILSGASLAADLPPASTGDVELIARDALFGNPAYASVEISPDGRWLSWVAPLQGVKNIWVAPSDAPDQARAITNDTARGIGRYRWTHRPDTLLYQRDSGGDENFHVYALNVSAGKAVDLSPFNKTQATIVGISHLQPDVAVIAMNDRDPKWPDLYQVNLASGERTMLLKNEQKLASFILDANLKVRTAAQPRSDGGSDLLKLDDKKGWTKFDEIPFEDALTTALVGYTTDGKTQYLLESRQRDTAAAYAIDTDSGKRTLLLEDARADVGHGAWVHPQTGRVQALAIDYLRQEWKVLDPTIQPDMDRLRAFNPGDFSVQSRSQDDKHWIVAYQSAERPQVFYHYDRAGKGTLTRLFAARPELDGKPLVAQWPVVIPARDGLKMVSYLALPSAADTNADGKADKPVPLVLLVHGGPYARDAYGYSSNAQWLANRGYAVLQVNYRGSTGFGKSFVNAGDGEWAGKMHDDLLDAVQWAVGEKITTPEQVAIMGGSYGGYATLVGMTFTPDTFKCGVDIVGPSNLQTLLATIPPYWQATFEQFAHRIGDPRTEAGRTLLAERSPLTHVEKIRKPLLIGQGANDPRVKRAEADQIVRAMQARKIPVTYALFPDEGHGFGRPENATAFNALTEGFLGQCLGGRVQPIGDDLAGSSLTVPTGVEGIAGLAAALKSHQTVEKK